MSLMKIKHYPRLGRPQLSALGKQFRFGSQFRAVFLQLAVERRLPDAQHSRRHQFVAVQLCDCAQDCLLLQIDKGNDPAHCSFRH